MRTNSEIMSSSNLPNCPPTPALDLPSTPPTVTSLTIPPRAARAPTNTVTGLVRYGPDAHHSPRIPLLYTWRCCQPSCSGSINSRNTYRSDTHFTLLGRRNGYQEWGPGYVGADSCEECEHLACEGCRFLKVERKEGEDA
ncbi:uncharacterized protein K460DRAFT_122124 [Cucurbitaria berberidis CBS 394.84]|uniref:Uncharacterized protein n=1 Tax=Cucurbitaria berberidis CBS 394.84 TaxID=1168544 RepID=A0A9P4L9C3_9PLEO|nr:uncharacterized protein K460DRAFT_122124 [Cucurbitaria berberidis CBS 394.84]KAF1846232.1 hypothetical protein K460DRAFT_122124 [Cucurbitaria berberidis CBS 394.84]